jgi:pentatricopeptide repeat protein
MSRHLGRSSSVAIEACAAKLMAHVSAATVGCCRQHLVVAERVVGCTRHYPHRWAEANSQLVQPNLVHFNMVIRALGRRREWPSAMALFAEVQVCCVCVCVCVRVCSRHPLRCVQSVHLTSASRETENAALPTEHPVAESVCLVCVSVCVSLLR